MSVGITNSPQIAVKYHICPNIQIRVRNELLNFQQHPFHRQGQNCIPSWLPHRGIQHKIQRAELLRGAGRLPQFHSHSDFTATQVHSSQCQGRQTSHFHI